MKKLRLFLVNVGFRVRMYPLATPPLGQMYLAAYIRKHFDVDVQVENQRETNISTEKLARQIIDFRPDIVGLGALTPFAHHQRELAEKIRAGLKDAIIVLGGPHISSFGAQALEKAAAADCAVSGEGERSFELICRCYLEGDGKDFSEVPGLHWRKDGVVVSNPGIAPVIEELDSLPMPAYDLIDLPRYWKVNSMAPIPRRRYATLFSTRGCPYGCTWCHRVFGKQCRFHSAERIADEVEFLSNKYGIDDFEFVDDIFNLDRKRILELAAVFGRRKMRPRFVFPNGLRGDILDEETIDALVDGCGMYFCSFALETGSPRLQQLMGKRLRIPRFLDNIAYAVRKGVFTNGFMMLGFPTETAEELQMTIDVANHSQLHTGSFFTVTPFPNTELYKIACQIAPEKLEAINYEDMTYISIRVNISSVSDRELFYYQRKANIQFYLNPRRFYRMWRDFPQRSLLFLYAPMALQRMTKGLLFKSDE
ncbi:MAG TPA: B12-binding domain-containing radical SAM protein [Candidatus Hydrogenedentes bacterium]|nr:B12-binding domain-containing radical SAM protein [Candidatus Hydrogenedentota bacterium]